MVGQNGFSHGMVSAHRRLVSRMWHRFYGDEYFCKDKTFPACRKKDRRLASPGHETTQTIIC